MAEDFAIRRCRPEDSARLQAIRAAAFAPIHKGFCDQLGEKIAERVRTDQEEKQAAYLDTLIAGSELTELHVLCVDEQIVGFIGITVDEDGTGGELDLNAVDPAFQGRGGGRYMYQFALSRLKSLGVTLARVGTGLDANHAAARVAYGAVGFDRSLSWTVLYKLL